MTDSESNSDLERFKAHLSKVGIAPWWENDSPKPPPLNPKGLTMADEAWTEDRLAIAEVTLDRILGDERFAGLNQYLAPIIKIENQRRERDAEMGQISWREATHHRHDLTFRPDRKLKQRPRIIKRGKGSSRAKKASKRGGNHARS